MKNNGKTKITEEELYTLIAQHVKGDKIKLNEASLVGLTWIHQFKNILPRRIDGCEITNSYIRGSDFSYVKFNRSNFQGTVFKRCDLTGVNFGDAQMEGCSFIDCPMLSVEMEYANLKGSHFHNCVMLGARLSYADFEGGTFEKTNFERTRHINTKGLEFGKVS
jgi:uncharacterized protein YjbI with pentapeptide repeats